MHTKVMIWMVPDRSIYIPTQVHIHTPHEQTRIYIHMQICTTHIMHKHTPVMHHMYIDV